VEPAKDWRSDCLAKRNLFRVELCGVLGRLHSIEGLAQSNNNAKLNYSAKHDQMLLETSAKVDEAKKSKPWEGEVLVGMCQKFVVCVEEKKNVARGS
jgi:hypothetical protein